MRLQNSVGTQKRAPGPGRPCPATQETSGGRGRAQLELIPLSLSPPQGGIPTGTGSALTAQTADGTQVSPPGVGGTAHGGQMVFLRGKRGAGRPEEAVSPQ